ncbi:MAG: hypothetical protein A4S09_17195 [Proteobacteria bacterium SG_bin7]|nr:MAG: hypothetical protein A4S09_17195 [Proteobacteria bacterium SG_bin7]
MLLEISLRPLNKSDVNSIMEIMGGLIGLGLPQWTIDQVVGELNSGSGLGAFLPSDELAAFVLYKRAFDHVDITFLASRNDLQNRGIMTQVLRNLFSHETQLPFWLEVHEGNLSARKFYEKLALREVGRRPRYYRDNGSAILYSTSI